MCEKVSKFYRKKMTIIQLLFSILFFSHLMDSSLSDNSSNTYNNLEKLIKEIFIIPTSELEAKTIKYPNQLNTNHKKLISEQTAATDVCIFCHKCSVII